MTIKDCIDIVDNIKPNQYTVRDKVMWLSFIDEIIINEVLKTHEGYDGRYDNFEGYTEDKLSVPLIVPSPYDRLYTAYLKMKIDQENGEAARYNNSVVLFNSYMSEYRKYYNKTHMPLNTIDKRDIMPQRKATSGLSDAEYENLKKDMTFILTEYFSSTLSDDKVAEVVNKFVQNNIEMLKGKNGYTPIKGVDYFDGANGYTPKRGIDYWNNEDKAEIKEYVNLLLLKPHIRTITISLLASAWVEDSDNRYSQIVSIEGITSYSKIDLQPTAEQLSIFHEKDIAFVTENDEGVVTIYCIGQKPTADYSMQATVTEVEING